MPSLFAYSQSVTYYYTTRSGSSTRSRHAPSGRSNGGTVLAYVLDREQGIAVYERARASFYLAAVSGRPSWVA